MRLRTSLLVGACLIGRTMAAGEASYQETTKITGGSVVGMMKFAGAFSKQARKFDQPIVSTVSVRGNRMSRDSQDQTQIIDLDAETITEIDKLKHQYSVVTFEQMKHQMEQAAEKAKAEQAKAGQNQQAKAPADSNVEVGFDAHARKTGATKQVSGIETNEVILTLAMNGKDKTSGQQGAFAITNDMWMAPDVPGYEEVREFNRKFAAKMGSTLGGSSPLAGLVQQAAAGDAIKSLAKEMGELKGVPVLQVMRMGMTTDGQPLPAASEAALPASSSGDTGSTFGSEVARTATNTSQQTAAQETSSRVGGVLGSGLGSAIGGFGGFSGFGRKKKAAVQDTTSTQPNSSTQTATAQSTPSQSPATAGVLVESVTEVGRFSQQVDPALMEVPAGYKLVSTNR